MTNALAFLPLTFDTIRDLSNLAPAPDKTHLIQSINRTIPQSLVSEETHTFGAFKGRDAVGLIALEDARVMNDLRGSIVGDCLLIWQLLVDGHHERQGIGTAMVDFAKSYSGLVGLSGVALATLDNVDHTPLPFYEKQGFTATGRRIQDGPDNLLELVWRPARNTHRTARSDV